MIDFDFFAATLDCAAEDVINSLTDQLDMTSPQTCKPRYGYQHGVLIRRGSLKLASAYWGGPNGRSDIHVVAVGDESPTVRSALCRIARQLGVELSVTRVDARQDVVESGFFDRAAAVCTELAQRKGLKISQVGDWVRGQGRTLYIGSRSSETMARIYEKGFQMGGDADWVRLELEFKPRTRKRRIAASSFTPDDVFSMGIGSSIFPALGLGSAQGPDLPSASRPSDTMRAREFLIKQYGPTIACWAREVGGYSRLAPLLESQINKRRITRQ